MLLVAKKKKVHYNSLCRVRCAWDWYIAATPVRSFLPSAVSVLKVYIFMYVYIDRKIIAPNLRVIRREDDLWLLQSSEVEKKKKPLVCSFVAPAASKAEDASPVGVGGIRAGRNGAYCGFSECGVKRQQLGNGERESLDWALPSLELSLTLQSPRSVFTPRRHSPKPNAKKISSLRASFRFTSNYSQRATVREKLNFPYTKLSAVFLFFFLLF